MKPEKPRMALVYSYPKDFQNVSRMFCGSPESTGYSPTNLLSDMCNRHKDIVLSSLELNLSLGDIHLNSMNGSKNCLSYQKSRIASSRLKSILKRSSSMDVINTEHFEEKVTVHTSRSAEDLDKLSPSESPTACSKSSRTVSFADDNNLSLVEIKNFVPSSERIDLWSEADEVFQRKYQVAIAEETEFEKSKDFFSESEIKLCFTEPCASKGFLERFKHRCVSLEKCDIRGRTLSGIVLVKNIEYSKHVFIRYTLNGWSTNHDTEATYVPNSNDIVTDRFHFSITLPQTVNEMEFAICFKTSSNEFWDNNYNRNYKVVTSFINLKDIWIDQHSLIALYVCAVFSIPWTIWKNKHK